MTRQFQKLSQGLPCQGGILCGLMFIRPFVDQARETHPRCLQDTEAQRAKVTDCPASHGQDKMDQIGPDFLADSVPRPGGHMTNPSQHGVNLRQGAFKHRAESCRHRREMRALSRYTRDHGGLCSTDGCCESVRSAHTRLESRHTCTATPAGGILQKRVWMERLATQTARPVAGQNWSAPRVTSRQDLLSKYGDNKACSPKTEQDSTEI